MIYVYFLIFVLFFVAELLYFKIADRFNIIDKPNERSSHTKITLRGGGIIFYIAMLVYLVYSGFSYPYFLGGLTLISVISFMDDVKPRSPKFRLTIHFVSILLMFYQWNLFAITPWYVWLIALILCIGILNAYNFMDGINGITGGYSFVVILALWYINKIIAINFVDNNIILFLLISLVVFNFFNFRKKAKCFAGDIGAVTIAFIIIFLIGKLMIITNDFSYIILLILYGVDTVLTIFHRIILKEDLTQAHRKHMFQIMANELKIPHLKVSIIYMVVQTIIIIGFFLVNYHYTYLFAIIVLLCIIYLLFMKKYFYLHKKNCSL
ncbi:MAG: glycosyltransferase family 4 protein [Paludibacteraceae bacterium]